MYRLILACFGLLLTTCSFAFVNCDYDQNKKITIYYANGMFNENSDLVMGKRFLQLQLNTVLHKYRTQGYEIKSKSAVNSSEGILQQLRQVAAQKYDEVENDQLSKWSKISRWLDDYQSKRFSNIPKWLSSLITDTFTKDNVLNDGDLQKMIAQYRDDINACKKVFVVAHSQGNFYTNLAWDDIYNYIKTENESLSANYSTDELAHMAILSVGTPANRVGGKIYTHNDHLKYTDWVTSYNDVVISWFVGSIADILPALYKNTGFEYGDKDRDIKHHTFVDSYLKGNETKPAIISKADTLIANLISAKPQADNMGDVSANDVTSGIISFSSSLPPNAYVRIVPQNFQSDNGQYTYGDGLRCKISASGQWGQQDCLISSASNKSFFTTSNTYQFLVFSDNNGDTHFNANESSICFQGDAVAWNSWASLNCPSGLF